MLTLSTVLPLSIPNWLTSPLKPRAQLCIEVTSDHDDYQLRVKKIMRVKMSKVQNGWCSRYGIEFQYNDLAWDDLITLQVWVDKKNSMEFLLDSIYYLYNYYMVCVPLSHTHHVTLSCDVTLWHCGVWLWCVTFVIWHFSTTFSCIG